MKRRQISLHWQQGFALLELAIATALTAMIVVWGAGKFAHEVEDTAGRATGAWLFEVKRSIDQMLSLHFDALSEGIAPTDPAGKRLFNDPLRPTLQELRAQGHLPSSFPEQPPLGGFVSIRLLPAAVCPDPGCRIDALAYLPPVRISGTEEPDLMRLAVAVTAGQGYAGFVTSHPSNRARGASFDFPNPLVPGEAALAAGTLLIWSGVDQTANQQFVRMRDVRNPDLQGAFSVAKRMTVGEHLKLEGLGVPGASCGDESGVFARNQQGGMLSCQAGAWQMLGGTFTIDGPKCPVGAVPVAFYIALREGDDSSLVWQNHSFADRCRGAGGDAGFDCGMVHIEPLKVKCIY